MTAREDTRRTAAGARDVPAAVLVFGSVFSRLRASASPSKAAASRAMGPATSADGESEIVTVEMRP